jgi:hypothetical protein
MSNQLNRKYLMVNQRTGITQEFKYVEPTIKSVTKPSILSWASRGKGVQGESYNSSDANGFRQIINRRRKPM